MTKTEQRIMRHVRQSNERGALAGVSDREIKFAKRLADAGLIVWVDWNRELGAGYALVGYTLAGRSIAARL